MSEEQLARMESTLEVLVVGQNELRAGQNELRTGYAELLDGQHELRAGQTELRADVSELRAGQTELRAGVSELRAGQVAIEVRLTKVEVRQEEMGDHIKVIAEGHATLLAAVNRTEVRLLDALERRVAPLELAFRERPAPSRRRR